MDTRLALDIPPQPDDVTCGPTCLKALYRYYEEGDALPAANPPRPEVDAHDIARLTEEIRTLPDGGTLAVFLANHALKRGYGATMYTYNLTVFDPSWFAQPGTDIAAKLDAQLAVKRGDPRIAAATAGYREFLKLGGRLRFEDLTGALIGRILSSGKPILTGLSATYLYRAMRERPETSEDDDVAGWPSGHFVVLCGYAPKQRQVLVADPYAANPIADGQRYTVKLSRLIGAIFLGALTHDANLLILEPQP
ncbi:C39 family peptidase [Algiphilus sp. NNCM1]|uniref:C39 family peptidase n=1 Tax=Algiphilus sp. TaxID=1872431 RepID=UPI001CA68A3E|nr:C39 family peptidase [Algiphilus sp.]MBY8964265.1 C39 family peptidase [Algiphilus acroporae]MCI5061917.1 C39 family peptidase [Algiphilus sp.]MCI5103357.1 C39 family peptidase [Algiphilus sp.]